MFDLFVEIETTKLANDSKQVDLAEALYIYSKNQFLRELRRLTCDDEAKTLRYQLWSMSDMNARSLDELGTHWMTAIKNAEHMESDLHRIEQGEIDASSHLRIDVVKEPPPENAAPDLEKHEPEAQNLQIQREPESAGLIHGDAGTPAVETLDLGSNAAPTATQADPTTLASQPDSLKIKPGTQKGNSEPLVKKATQSRESDLV